MFRDLVGMHVNFLHHANRVHGPVFVVGFPTEDPLGIGRSRTFRSSPDTVAVVRSPAAAVDLDVVAGLTGMSL